jgi:hypothetical protein
MKSAFVDVLIALLREEPENWSYEDSCVLRHKSGVSIWVYLGAARLWEPHEQDFGLLGWWRLRRACKPIMRAGKRAAEARRLQDAADKLKRAKDNIVAFRRQA